MQVVDIKLLCDLEPEDKPRKADGTVSWGYGGQAFEVDLCGRHSRELEKVMAEIIPRSRGPQQAPQPDRRVKTDRQRGRDIRDWARGRGIRVSDRGRIAADVEAQYEVARGA